MRIKIAVVVILLLAVVVSVVFFYNVNDKNDYTKYQWYLDNTGDSQYITESEDYKSYITMKASVDISWKEMRRELPDETDTITVAVIDTGIDYFHEELKDSMWINENEIPEDGIDNDMNGYIDDYYGYDFCNDKGYFCEAQEQINENGHGTMCAGIIAASDDKNGISGVASCIDVKIMSLKVLDSQNEINTGKPENLIKAIEYAEHMGADICNMSLSFSEHSEELEEVMKNSRMLFVVSSGNGSGRGLSIDEVSSYPAGYKMDNLITVANLNYNGKLNKSSNYGKESVDIAAPGTCIYTTFVNNEYRFGSGTSMAAAVASGVAAVIKASNKTITAAEIKEKIMKSVNKTDELTEKTVSGGYLNGYLALKEAKNNY